MEKKETRQSKLGIQFADALIEMAHQMYNARRGCAIINACIKRLRERSIEIVAKPATPQYKEARYGKKG